MGSIKKYFDRDLSWLSFNERVLLEAERSETPVFEKLKFLAIYSSNLDEFYRVRVAAFQRVISDGKLEEKELNDYSYLLREIQSVVDKQQERFGSIYRDIVLPELNSSGIRIAHLDEISVDQKNALREFFRIQVLGSLHQQAEKPFLENRKLYLVVDGLDESGERSLRYLNIPTDRVNRFISVPDGDNHVFLFLDDLIRLYLNEVITGFEIQGVYAIKLNRDAELYLDEAYRSELKKKIQRALSNRSTGSPSRVLIDESMGDEVRERLAQDLDLRAASFVNGARYHNFYDFFSLPNPLKPQLEYPKVRSIRVPELVRSASIFDEIDKKDFLLNFPYQPYDYVLMMFNEAATNPEFTEIRATMYRMAADSAIGAALMTAAKNGKKVVVFVELKARFDEANNITWADKMKAAGVKIIYSIPDIKVHAKVALFTRQKGGKKKRYAFYGTGNFNEKTASIYTDHALLTSDVSMNAELESLLKYLDRGRKEPAPQELLIEGFNMVDRFTEMIDKEIAFAREGKEAQITIKINNLEDKPMIKKLYEASQKGVKINLIVRGILCLRPGVEGLSENIQVFRVVGRYLEHGRVFKFENGGDPLYYMGSADWMKRNLRSRIEVVFPIKDSRLKKQVEDFIRIQLSAHRGTVEINSELQNDFPYEEESNIGAQEAFYRYLKG